MAAIRTLLWIDPILQSGATTAAVAHHDQPTVYRFYRRCADGSWLLIAACADSKDTERWFNHRVDPAEVTSEFAEWLNTEVASMWRASGGGF